MSKIALRNRLGQVLRDRSMSRRELADLCDLPYPTIRKIVRTQSDPFLADAMTVATALGMEVDDLFSLGTDALAEHAGVMR